jgi:LPXTG-motif cell wall-anchored protein
LVISELLPGKTFEDVYAVLNGPPTQGPPAGLFAGDASYADLFAAPAQSFTKALTLHPGNYIALCPIPDAASGKPHFALGMIQELRVRSDAPATPVALPDTGVADSTRLALTLGLLAGAGLLGGALLRRKARRV